MQAADLERILRKQLAFLSGGKDKHNRPIITIPNVQELFPSFSYEIQITLKYFLRAARASTKFTVLIDIRSSSWSVAKPVIRILQECMSNQIGLLCLIKPGEFVEKQKANFNFTKYKSKLNFMATLTSASKLPRYVDPSQLTVELGGKLQYSHQQWINNLISFDSYMEEAKKRIDELKEKDVDEKHRDCRSVRSDTSNDWSDSGHHTGQTSSSSTTDVSTQRSGFYRIGDVTRSLSHYRSIDDVYCSLEVDSFEKTSSSKEESSQSISTKPLRTMKKKNKRFDQTRRRTRSVSPRRRSDRFSSDSSFETCLHDPFSNYCDYSVPFHGTKDRNDSSSNGCHTTRSKSDRNVDAEEQRNELTGRSTNTPRRHRQREASINPRTASTNYNVYVNTPKQRPRDRLHSNRRRSTPRKYEQPISRSNSVPGYLCQSKSDESVKEHLVITQTKSLSNRNGPRPLHRRNRENSKEIKEMTLSKSKSTPDLTKSAVTVRRNSTIIKGEKLLRNLSSATDENGFALNVNHGQISDQTMVMIEKVNKYQKTLEKLEKTKKSKEKRNLRRKSIIGIPEVDHLTNASSFPTLLTPIEMKNNLKLVFDWFREEGRSCLNSITPYGLTLTENENMKKKYDYVAAKMKDQMNLMSETKKTFDSLSSAHPSFQRESNPAESVPQWIISLKKNFEVVANHGKTFRSRLFRLGEIMNSSLSFFLCAKKLSKSLHLSIDESNKSEATLLDELETIQKRLDQLQECCQDMELSHEAVKRKAEEHFHLVRTKSSNESEEQQSAQRQKDRIHEILKQFDCGVKRCSKLTETCKVHLTQVYQLKSAKNNVQQAVEWLCKTRTCMKENQADFGRSSNDIADLMRKHELLEKTAKIYYDNGNKQLSSMSVLRRCLELSPPHGAVHSALQRNNSSAQLVSKSGKLLPSLEEAWESFNKAWTERRSKLLIIQLFYQKAEQLFKRGSRLEEDLEQLYQSASNPQPLSPLRDAHHLFHGDWDNVRQLGQFILNKTTNPQQSKNLDSLKVPIHHHLNQLEKMLVSLQAKWSRVSSKTPTPRSESSGGSRLSRWFENVTEMTDYVRRTMVGLSSGIFEIGRNYKESSALRDKFEELVCEVKKKIGSVGSTFNEGGYKNTFYFLPNTPRLLQNSSQDKKVHSAINQSLSDLWKDFDSLMIRRHAVLYNSVNFHQVAEKFGNQLTCLEQYLQWEDIPLDEYTARSLLHILKEMYDTMLEESSSVLDEEKNLLNILTQLKSDDPDKHKNSSYESACVIIECVIQSLMERKHLIEFRHRNRKKQLEHSLKIRKWEKKVDEVTGWFETTREMNLEQTDLGVDESNTRAMICHIDQIKDFAQERLEQAKKLIALARNELKVFGTDSVKLQSHALDKVGESFMLRVDKRKEELNAALEFYNLVKKSETSLEALEAKLKSGRFSTDQEEAEEQRLNYLNCVNAAADPVIQKASNILRKRENESEAVEGIIESRDNVVNKQLQLREIIDKHSTDSAHLRDTIALFMSNCDKLQKKIKDFKEKAFHSDEALTSSSEEASKFHKWHQELFDDVEKESNKINTIVETANVLLESGVANSADIKSQAESLTSAWLDLNRELKQRLVLAEESKRLLSRLESLLKKIETAHSLVLEQSKTTSKRAKSNFAAEVENQANDIDNECLEIMELSNELNASIRQVEINGLDTSAAVTTVTQKVVELHRKKSQFKDIWLTWKYKNGVTQETSMQINTLKKTINALLLSLEKIEQLVFLNDKIYLGSDLGSNQILQEKIQERQSSLDVIMTEITDTVKHAEMLGMRLSTSVNSTKEEELSKEQVLRGSIKNLLTHHQQVYGKIKDYKTALNMAKKSFKHLENMRKIMGKYERKSRDSSALESSDHDQFLLDVRLGSCDVILEQLDHLLEAVDVESDQVRNFIKKSTLSQISNEAEDFDQALDEIKTEVKSWKETQNNQKEILLNQKELIDFNKISEKHVQKLTDTNKKLKDLKEQMINCQSQIEAVALREESLNLLDETKKHKEEWGNSMTSLESQGVNTDRVDNVIERTRQQISAVATQAQNLYNSAATLEKVYKLSDECDKWNEEIQQIMTKIRAKSELIRSSQEAEELSQFLDINLKRRLPEQTERYEEVDSALNEDEADPSENPPDLVVVGLSEEERLFRSLLRKKQIHVKESLKALRGEIDDLSELIERTKKRLVSQENQVFRAKPYYDLSVLYEKNLDQERKTQKLIDDGARARRKRTLNQAETNTAMLNSKDDFLSSPSSSSLMLSSITTSSTPYELSEDNTNTFMDNEDDENEVERTKEENLIPCSDFQQSRTSSESSLSSAINKALSFKTTKKTPSPPPQTRRNAKSKGEVPNAKSENSDWWGRPQRPRSIPRNQNKPEENGKNSGFLFTKDTSRNSSINRGCPFTQNLSPLPLSVDSSFSNCDTDVLLQADAFTGLEWDQDLSGSDFDSSSSFDDSQQKRENFHRSGTEKNIFKPIGNKKRIKLPISKARDTFRVSKSKNSYKTTYIFPHRIVEASSPIFKHKRSESFLSSSSSVWDTDCLVAADPRSTKIPSVLLHSARNEMDFESDETDDLLRCDPLQGFDSSSTDDTLTPFDRQASLEKNDWEGEDSSSSGSSGTGNLSCSEKADTSYETIVVVNNFSSPSFLRGKNDVDCGFEISVATKNADHFLKSPMSPPSFIQGLKGIISVQGGAAQFEAVVAGTPLPEIRWFHDNEDVTFSHNYQVTTTAEGRSSLQIAEVFDEDAGQFTCRASNQHGTASTSAELVVQSVNISNDLASTNSQNFHSTPNSEYQLQKAKHVQLKPGHLDEVKICLGANRKVWENIYEPLHGEIYKSDTGYTSMNSSVAGKQLEKLSPGSNFVFSSLYRSEECHDLSSLSSFSQMKHVDVFSPSSFLFVDQDFAIFPPYIKTKITELEVKEGEMSLLSCEVIGNPIPHVTWYRDGVQIDNSHDFEISFTGKITTLFIRDTETGDAGSYTCCASNEEGSASCVILLKVKSLPPELRKKDTNQVQSASEMDLSITDYEGTEAELDFVSGVSEAEVTDTEFFKPVSGSVSAPRLSNGKESVTTLEEKNSQQEKYSAIGKAPKFEMFPPDKILLVEGGSIRLDCVISGIPTPLVTWSKNDAILKTGYRCKIIEDKEKNKYSLLFGMLLAEDAGEYKVTATNQFGFISGSIFFVSEEDYSTKVRETSKLGPQPDFLTQGDNLEVQPHLQSSQEDQEKFSSVHSNLNRSTSDTKKTLLSPTRSRKSVSPLYNMPTSHRQDDDVISETEKYFRPKFLIKPGSREGKEGETTRIDCKVTGRPMPEVTFLRYGSTVEGSRHRAVVKEDGIHSLIISPMLPEDTGEYRILAENTVGKEECAMDLTVLAQEDSESPRILEKPRSMSVREGELVRLEVFASGKPTPEIAWLKDNLLLKPSMHPDIRIEGVDGHGLLTIEKAGKSLHDAWYTATAVNKSGRDLIRCKVNVLKSDDSPVPQRKSFVPKTKKPTVEQKFSLSPSEIHRMEEFSENDLYGSSTLQKPCFKKKLRSRKQKTLGSVHFECVIVPVGDPSMKIQWLLEGKPLECANRIKEKFEFGHASLDISTVYPRDTGVISCRATNEHGQAQSSCTLIVKEERGLDDATQLCDAVMLERIKDTEKHRQEMSLIHDSHLTGDQILPSPPKVVLPLEPVRVQEGESAKFQCRILGYPLPTVNWFLNKQIIRPSKRFRIWEDGIHYFEIKATKGYDSGVLRLLAENSLGQDEVSTTIEVYQGQDMRSVLHKSPSTTKEKSKTPGFKQHRMAKNIEDKFRDKKGKHMVQLKQVNKPKSEIKLNKKLEREDELQKKFSQLSEEDHVLKAYEASKKKATERDRDYETFIRKTKSDLAHRQKIPASKQSEHDGKFGQIHSSKPLRIEQHIKNLTVSPGQTANFLVRFSGDSNARVTWFRRRVELEKSDRIEYASPENGVCELYIRNVTTNDAGPLSVQITDTTGQVGSQCFLSVLDTSNRLHFTETLHDIFAKEHDKSAIFESRLSQLGHLVTWYFTEETINGRKLLSNGEKYQILTEGSQHRLRVCNIKLSDAGKYSCLASENDEEVETSASLYVTALEKTVMQGLMEQAVNEGENACFTAVVSHDDVKGSWFKDDEKIEPNQKFNVENSGTKRSLTVRNCRTKDAGVYEFKYELCSTKAALCVEGKAVKIVDKLKPQRVFGGDSVTFSVKLSRSDAVGSWKHDGVDVMPNERIIVGSDWSNYFLKIDTCEQQDSGTYSFIVGDVSTEASLSVQDVAIVGELNDVTVLETSIAKFTCKVDQANYKAGKWFENGTEISPDGTKYLVKTINQQQELIIKDITRSYDGGSYAYVTGSESVTQAQMHVLKVDVTQPHCDVTAYESESAKFEVHLSHDGAVGTWYKNSIALKESSDLKLEVNARKHSLIIQSLTMDDRGIYEFRVAEKSCVAELNVNEILFSQTLSDTIVTETKSAILSCEVNCDNLMGKWFKNDKLINDEAGARYHYSHNGRYHQLAITNVRKEDNAKFTFQVGRASTTARVDVTESKFVKGLRNITVSEGSDACFQVEVFNEDLEGVCWEKNCLAIPCDNAKYEMKSVGKVFILTIRSVTTDDEATYSCVAGSARTSARLYVEGGAKNQSDSTEKSSIQNFQVVSDESELSQKTSSSSNSLTSASSRTVQIGSTRSHPTVAVGETSRENKVDDKQKLCDVERQGFVTSLPENLIVGETQTATFKCSVAGSKIDDSSCYWFKNETVLKTGDRIKISNDHPVYTLEIFDCTVNDVGSYKFKCGDYETTTTLKIMNSHVVITSACEQLDAIERSAAALECKVDRLNVHGRWCKDGEPIVFLEQSRLKYKIDGFVHRLQIDYIIEKDSGKYKFQVDNSSVTTQLRVLASASQEVTREDIANCAVDGSVQTGISPILIKNKQENQIRTNKNEMPVRNSPKPLPPSIVTPMEDCITLMGKKAQFCCEVAGTGVQVTWSCNGEEISENHYYNVSRSKDCYKLEILEVSSNDQGTYEMTARNEQGEISCSACLRYGKIEPPTVVKPLQPGYVIEGSAVRMEWVIKGVQLNIRWYKGGRDITDDKRYKSKLDRETGCCYLVIPDCKMDDAGEIRSRASNWAGEAVCSTELVVSGVRRPKKKNKFTDINFDVTPMIDDVNSDQLQVRSSMTGKHFTIRRSDVNRLVGNYISQSDVDPSLSDAPILAKAKSNPLSELDDDLIAPAFTKKPKLQSVLTENSAIFRCSFVASPRPKVTWFHCNTEIKRNSDRHVITLEREMLSYQACLEVKNCQLEDAGVYRIRLNNKRGEASNEACLVVTERDVVLSRSTDDLDTSSSGTYCEPPEKLKTYLSESDLHQATQNVVFKRLYGPLKCSSAPGSGTITPRQPYSPRLYYQRRNKDVRSTCPSDVGSTDVFSASGHESRASKISDFDQSFSSVSSLSSLSNVSPTRLAHSFDSDDHSSSLSRSLSSADQRKLNSIKTALAAGLLRPKGNLAFSDSESVVSRSFDEHSIGTLSELSAINNSNSNTHKKFALKAAKKASPKIVTPLPENILAVAGNQLCLSCVISGFPRPKIVWMKDAESIDNNTGYISEQTEFNLSSGETAYRATLTITNVTSAHNGTYALTCYNRLGDSTTGTKISIQTKKERVAP